MQLQSLKQIGRMQRIVECSKYLLNEFCLFIQKPTRHFLLMWSMIFKNIVQQPHNRHGLKMKYTLFFNKLRL